MNTEQPPSRFCLQGCFSCRLKSQVVGQLPTHCMHFKHPPFRRISSSVNGSCLLSQHLQLLQQLPSLQSSQKPHLQSSWFLAPHLLHRLLFIISISTLIFFTLHSAFGQKTQTEWGWAGSCGSSFTTPKKELSALTGGSSARATSPPGSERTRDTSCSSRRTSVSLWLLPIWTFKPRCDSDSKSHWLHLNFFFFPREEAAACSSINLQGGKPFSSTRRWW